MSDKLELRNFIGGEQVPAAEGSTYDLIDPAAGEVYATAPMSGSEDVDRAMYAAASAFESWGETTPAERQLALLKLADAMESRASDIIDAEVRNTGKPRELTASEELPPSIDQIRFFAGAARVLEGRSAGGDMSGMTSMIPSGTPGNSFSSPRA